MGRDVIAASATAVACAAALMFGAGAQSAEYIKGTWQENRSFSPAVVTDGGKVVWLAGHGGIQTDDHKPITKFSDQVHQAFKNIEATLKRSGGTLQDIVTMTVFINDVRHGDEFVKIRSQYFKEGFPGSALITVAGFAVPELMVEIQAVAVIGEKN
jgi:enamine deaminase RidA (YjgF/YER057c/UK114 family)